MFTRPIATRVLLPLLALVAATATTTVRAQDDAEVEPPIDIYAVESHYDLRAGVTRFENDVSITRGAMAVQADRGVLRQLDGQISEVELEGSPITWRDELSDGSIVTGESTALHYDVLANVVTLTGNAVIRHQQGEFTGDELVYDLTAESLAGRSTGNDRVRVIIEPETMSDPRSTVTPPPQETGAEPTPESTTGNGAGDDSGSDEAAAVRVQVEARSEAESESEPDPEPPADEDPATDPDDR
ncbi:lipopolysaccharide transport periplasmic protein LptA [Wenzhouxiangella sp. XN79A]|uniref:lipopolysaccharide transport periplasmic protein LptA n=1 Tax=Wenzhouxiangella sp. XN79A TaxID=2724193 RepID=UPI00144A6A5E|nr:lipopolysaccharide transport periplasmic protein LptA [Wenzhouxiangella sp. XN79A]NKI36081.1 lipopolysaccharide transport periplasmic protein LptA [Wenzhouxiangella sp. XN79A]